MLVTRKEIQAIIAGPVFGVACESSRFKEKWPMLALMKCTLNRILEILNLHPGYIPLLLLHLLLELSNFGLAIKNNRYLFQRQTGCLDKCK
jgi:hypothetical protein